MSSDAIGTLEHLVLLVIARQGPDSYGVTIIEELRRHARKPVLRPSVYLALKRLESRGLIRSRLGAAEARRGGRATRHFTITPAGLRILRESQRMLTALWRVVPLTRRS